ncbi:MAG: DeoR/GlpR family DNA-binding transcription regulator [Planctomycetota bacterium]|jgi:DeoR/GlpR family transcriptional regulator of sugar metabolism
MSQASEERRKQIMVQLLDRKRVTVRELAASMDVSGATVRRDLKALADEEELLLVHGGATLPRQRDFSFRAKQLRAIEEKRVIGRLAAGLVVDGDHVFLDSGTTCSEMVPWLKKRHSVTVLANSARLALDLNAPGLSVFLIGGEYRPDRMDTVGPMATSTLHQVRGYVAFIGADGLSMDFGPSASDAASAHLHRLVIENSREAVLLVDGSKFGGASLFQICDWLRISKVVADREPDEQWMRFFEEQNIEVIYPQESND